MNLFLIFLLVVVGFAIMVAGQIYCDRVAERRSWNVVIARMVGLLIPVIGAVVYWALDRLIRAPRS